MAITTPNDSCTSNVYVTFNVETGTCSYNYSDSASTVTAVIPQSYTFDKPDRIRYKIKRGCRIRPVKGFTFGGCAAKAIGVAFKLDHSGVVDVFNSYKMDWENGVTFKQCERVIQRLAERNDKSVRYVSNHRGLKFFDFVKKYKVGTYICSLDEHVSCVRNGVVVDSFFYHDGPVTELEGWWEIKHK